ncbi:ComF family protein [Winogradskyella wandonensis]|uniref:ComF family protein n=1 Tax=Winogradskyella wandonensis TaxID=1442586 RepID=A0A4R1KJX0_9FLAO|nr:phosphoribosyltransferase family protein [Winogradskyella wandonensis]TCK65088.1 ComF family protein [Winogradskyella wandonensis]
MFQNLLNLFFPQICEACKTPLSDNEKVICVDCRHDLPITNFHYQADDAIKKILYGRVQLENATALLHFSKKGLVQELLHNLKYRGHEHIGEFLGKWLGSELKDLENYKIIDVVVPVPIHKNKLRERGYNQVTKFGVAIAEILNAEYRESALLKIEKSKTQALKDRLTRLDDAEKQFATGDFKGLDNKHILLVDDIITTGATVEACIELLNTIPGVRVSLAAMAVTE